MDSQFQLLGYQQVRIMLITSKRQLGRPSGFTLVELIVVMAIIAIAMVLGMQGISEWMLNARTRTAAEGVKNGLQAARAEAIRSNVAVAFTLATGGGGWTVTAVRSGQVIDSKPSAGAVVTPKPSGATTVTFTGLGRRAMTNSDGSTVLTSVEVNGDALRITISAGGEIRMCEPSVTDTGDPRAC